METFNNYCREACRLWGQYFGKAPTGKTSGQFDRLLKRVDCGGGDIIQTGWGGVVITLHQHPQVEKFLVIRKGGYLALEKHEEKDERLEMKEGAGLVLWRQSPNEPSRSKYSSQVSNFILSLGWSIVLSGRRTS